MRYTNDAGWSDFKNLIKEGTEGEQVAKLWLEARGVTNIKTIDECIEEGDDSLSKDMWDLKGVSTSGDVLTFEIKTQNFCHKYAGVNVEETQSGVDSGIKVSIADYYIFVNPEYGFGVVHGGYLKKISENGAKGFKTFITKAKNKATGFILTHNNILWIK